jgi:hypothetical protein
MIQRHRSMLRPNFCRRISKQCARKCSRKSPKRTSWRRRWRTYATHIKSSWPCSKGRSRECSPCCLSWESKTSNCERGASEDVIPGQILSCREWQCVWARWRQGAWRNETATESFLRKIFSLLKSWMNCSGNYSWRGRLEKIEESLLRAVAVREAKAAMAITSKLKLRKRGGLTNTLRNSTWDKGKGRDSGKRKDKDKSKGKDRGRGRDKSRDSDKGIELIALMTSVTRNEALSRRSSS